jgi:hypothetical protein
VIAFCGAYDKTLYIRAVRLQGAGLRWLGATFAVVGVLSFVTSANTANATWWAPGTFLTLFGALLLASPYLAARKAFKTGAMLTSPLTGRADETRFVLECAHGTTNITWALFYKAIIAPDLVLLFPSAHQFHIIARSFFASDDDWSAFQSVVRSSVPLKRPNGTMLRTAVLWMFITIAVFIIWSFAQS